MVTISKSVLKARMLEFFRRIEQTGEELVVTSNGVPVLKVVPYRVPVSIREVFGDLDGEVEYHADILESTTDEWSEV
jgi:antitoxin (DNA-binding transcriptional repressor) of toxin-antitoxin stability system